MTTESKIAEVEARRAARKAAISEERNEQYLVDLEALDALEVEHGDSAVARLDPERYVQGLPTFVVLKTPSSSQYRRFCDQLSRAQKSDNQKARQEAQEMLAKSCWVYPAQDAQAAMLEAFPGILLSIAIRAIQLVEAKEAETGKG